MSISIVLTDEQIRQVSKYAAEEDLSPDLARIQRARGEEETATNATRAQRDGLKQEIITLKPERDGLKKEIAQLQVVRDSARADLQSVTQELTEKQAAIAQYDALHTQVKRANL